MQGILSRKPQDSACSCEKHRNHLHVWNATQSLLILLLLVAVVYLFHETTKLRDAQKQVVDEISVRLEGSDVVSNEVLRFKRDAPAPRKKKIKGTRGRSRRRCGNVQAVHYVSNYPKRGNLFDPSQMGYLEDDVYRYWASEDGKDHLTKLPDEQPFVGARQVKKSGLYLIYAQITYYTHGTVGFTITKDNPKRTRLASCVETLPAARGRPNTEACATTVVTKLEKGNRLLLKPLYPNTNFSMVHSNTFWGLVKLC